MEFWYNHNNLLIHLYTTNQTEVRAYQFNKITRKGSLHFINNFSSSCNAIAYVEAIRNEKLNKAHAEALEMEAARNQQRTSSTEYVVETVSDGSSSGSYDFAVFHGGERNQAADLVNLLREKGWSVNLVKRVTTSEVIG